MMYAAVALRVVLPLMVLWGVSACGDRPAETARLAEIRGAVTRDSGGVTIVALPASSLPDASMERIVPEPAGRFNGGDEPLYRITAAFGLSDGRVAVTDRGSQSVRIFNPGGREVQRLGGPGEGPGEFQDVTAAGVLAPDSIWVYDFLASRLTVFGPAGEVRTERIDGELPFRTALGVLDRSLLLVESPIVVAGSEEGLRRDSVRLMLGSVSGGAPRSLDRFPGDEALVEIDARPGATTVIKTEMPFAYETHHSVVGNRVVTGETERYEFVFRDEQGDVRRVLRLDTATGRPIDAELRRAYAEAQADELGMSDRVPQLLRGIEAMPLHERAPAFRAMVAGGRPRRPDELWVGLPPDPRDSVAVWVRHETTGPPVETAVLPADLRLTAVTPAIFIGVRSDELGVEWVELYERSAVTR